MMTDLRPPTRPVAALAATAPLRAAPLPQTQTRKVPGIVRAEGISMRKGRARSPESDASMAPSRIQKQIRAFLDAQSQKRAAESRAEMEALQRARAEAFRKALQAPTGRR